MMPDELRRLLIDCQDLLSALRMHQFLLDLAIEQCQTPTEEAIVRAHILIECYGLMTALPVSDLEASVLRVKAHYRDGNHPPADLPSC